jgi:hypothetical protein
LRGFFFNRFFSLIFGFKYFFFQRTFAAISKLQLSVRFFRIFLYLSLQFYAGKCHSLKHT